MITLNPGPDQGSSNVITAKSCLHSCRIILDQLEVFDSGGKNSSEISTRLLCNSPT